MIEFTNLTVGFNGRPVLKNLNGSIQPGKLIALMGINGVGKSCLLKTLTIINPLINGELKIENTESRKISNLEMSKIMAVVLTDKIHVDFLSVEELICLGRSPHSNFWGRLSDADNQIISEIIKLLNIESIFKKLFSELSDGQKQKVLLARALVQEPRYLFLDEPTTYLDIPTKIELMKILKRLSVEKNIGVFFSTHDLNLIIETVDEIWLIDNEGLLHKKSPEDMHLSGLLQKNFNI